MASCFLWSSRLVCASSRGGGYKVPKSSKREQTNVFQDCLGYACFYPVSQSKSQGQPRVEAGGHIKGPGRREVIFASLPYFLLRSRERECFFLVPMQSRWPEDILKEENLAVSHPKACLSWYWIQWYSCMPVFHTVSFWQGLVISLTAGMVLGR